MFSKKGTDQLTGLLLVALVVGVVVSVVTFLVPFADLEFTRDELQGSLREIELDSELWFTSGAFGMFANLISIPLAAALYLTFRGHDRSLALIGSFGFLAAAVLELMRFTAHMALGSLALDFVVASGTEADSIAAAARSVSLVIYYALALGPMGIALGIFSYGALVVRSQALPRWIGWIGVVGGVVAPFGWLSFVQQDLFYIGAVGLIIGLVFAVTAGVRLLASGSAEAASG